MFILCVQDIKKRVNSNLGRNITSQAGLQLHLAGLYLAQAGIWPRGPTLRGSNPGWAWEPSFQLGQAASKPAGPGRPYPGLPAIPRLGRSSASRVGRRSSLPPAGPAPPRPAPAGLLRLAFHRLGRDVLPGWAGSFAPCRAEMCSPAWAGTSPGRTPVCQLDRFLCTVPAGPGRDSLAQAGLILPKTDICFLRHMLLVWHHLHCSVPVLGRLQARTGISFTVICWSWDAPWLRPAYPSSPGQSYPQEEDKTDDTVILKTDARRRRQGLQVQTSMGLCPCP
jgi:hypothetical protein